MATTCVGGDMRNPILQISAALALGLVGCSASPAADASKVDAKGMSMASAPEADSPTPVPQLIALSNRQVIRNGEISVRVPDVEAGEKAVQKAIRDAGGFVSDSTTTNLADTTSSLSMTLRVPVGRFDDMMSTIANLGTVGRKTTSTNDVTGQIADMDARLRVMRGQEEVYLRTLKQSGSLKDSMAVQDQLMQLREKIEGTGAQLKSQREQASFSTIKVTLEGAVKTIAVAKTENWAEDSFVTSRNNLLAALSGVGRFLISIGVYSPLWAPFAWLGWWLFKRNRPPQAPPKLV